MGLLSEIIKSLVTRLVDLSVNERINDYRSSFFRYQDMMTQITIERDKALMTFSIATLAALAALNDAVFVPYGWASFITLACFILVVVIVIIGYSVSKVLITDAQDIMTKNFRESLTKPLGEGLDKVKYAKLSKILNIASSSLFILGMISFVILMALFIKGV